MLGAFSQYFFVNRVALLTQYNGRLIGWTGDGIVIFHNLDDKITRLSEVDGIEYRHRRRRAGTVRYGAERIRGSGADAEEKSTSLRADNGV